VGYQKGHFYETEFSLKEEVEKRCIKFWLTVAFFLAVNGNRKCAGMVWADWVDECGRNDGRDLVMLVSNFLRSLIFSSRDISLSQSMPMNENISTIFESR